jgi:hypothetical protein
MQWLSFEDSKIAEPTGEYEDLQEAGPKEIDFSQLWKPDSNIYIKRENDEDSTYGSRTSSIDAYPMTVKCEVKEEQYEISADEFSQFLKNNVPFNEALSPFEEEQDISVDIMNAFAPFEPTAAQLEQAANEARTKALLAIPLNIRQKRKRSKDDDDREKRKSPLERLNDLFKGTNWKNRPSQRSGWRMPETPMFVLVDPTKPKIPTSIKIEKVRQADGSIVDVKTTTTLPAEQTRRDQIKMSIVQMAQMIPAPSNLSSVLTEAKINPMTTAGLLMTINAWIAHVQANYLVAAPHLLPLPGTLTMAEVLNLNAYQKRNPNSPPMRTKLNPKFIEEMNAKNAVGFTRK